MFVQVIVDVKNSRIDKKFYYKIPQKYINKNLLGYRVEVPFGSRIIQGYIVEQKENPNFDVAKIKEIKKIKDDYPVLNNELILLSSVLADELYCTQIQVIEAMLPTILKNKYKEYYKLAADDLTLFQYKKYFSNEGIVEKNKLERLLDSEELSYLISNKIIKLISIVEEQLKSNNEKYVTLNNFGNNIKLTAKQKILIDYLEKNIDIKKSLIKDKLQIGESVIKNLLEKDIIKYIYKENIFEANEYTYNNKNILNEEQTRVYNTVRQSLINQKFADYLLHGVTGSGKTEVYINLVKDCINLGKQAIILVPEIILTPQIEEKFKKVFGDNISVLHSRLNKKEKYDEWKKIKEQKVNICLGTRSAIFAPFENIGLIIIDEEHENSYKQQESPRYDAKDIAKKRAVFNKATLLYASATPSVDLYYEFKNFKKNRLLKLSKRFNNQSPIIDVISLENKENVIDEKLLGMIEETISKNEQVLLLINKRGYTNFIRCFTCGHIYKCEKCDISLNYHKNDKSLQCHFCGYRKKIFSIKKCCENPELVSGVFGIQKVEEYIKSKLPEAKIIRMDSDTTSRKGMYEKLLTDFKNKKADILLGTQMISKGLDFPDITLVGILSVDSMLAIPSFKSNEKLFQLLVQTSGRAGRKDKQGRVILQSNVDSNIVTYAVNADYEKFYEYEINRRKIIEYPPFCKISFIMIKGSDEEKTKLAAITIYNFLHKNYYKEKILGPNKSNFYKINNEYRFNIAVRFEEKDYNKLHKLLKYINNYFQQVYIKDKISIVIDNSVQDYI
ncbi:primosomal protein N' [Gemella sp. zg-1178]|uniref:replication restart helicase PriA n=1 Tax=Gemella sp. zg-1178 TaxID=2840372 RepID=UPI001C042B24|nr:primosomal protein N' [Gemella sp. zg-1178]MBU0278290.1 primosomal protein N' [Gemella sp. zg-1178]